MTNLRMMSLLGATALTVCATSATIDGWAHGKAAPALRTATLFAWLLYAISYYADRHLDELRSLRNAITSYGDERYGEGAIDAHARDQATPAPLQSIRR
jgi:hypothetical protein